MSRLTWHLLGHTTAAHHSKTSRRSTVTNSLICYDILSRAFYYVPLCSTSSLFEAPTFMSSISSTSPTMSNDQPRAFQISIPEALSRLKRKLDDTRLPDEVDSAGWDYGVPLAGIKRLAERWKNGYDWRAHERELNKIPMFTCPVEVEGFGELNVHYVHKRRSVNGAIPLLFVHGCMSPSVVPGHDACSTGLGSFLEVKKYYPR